MGLSHFMPESLLYVIFKDSLSINDEANLKVAVANIRDQLLAAADRLQVEPEAIYSYLKQESPVKKPEGSAEVEHEKPNIPIVGEDEILNVVFNKIKRTKKSENIIKYLVQNAGMELSVEQLTEGASVTKNDLSSWMATTGSKVTCITRPSRGMYKFDPDKLSY